MVPLNPLLKAPEIAYHRTDSGARLLITFEEFAAAAVKGAELADGSATYLVARPGSDRRIAGARPYDGLSADRIGEILVHGYFFVVPHKGPGHPEWLPRLPRKIRIVDELPKGSTGKILKRRYAPDGGAARRRTRRQRVTAVSSSYGVGI